jgi:hypothetical protein
MKHTKTNLIILACTLLSASLALGEEVPRGWFRAGSHPNDYEMSVDRSVAHSGKASACLKSIGPKPAGFGTLMQTFKAEMFRGKRVRMTGYVQSKGVTDWAGVWMRVDGQKGEPLAFDNMQDRPIKGTSDWTRCQVVLEVPETAQEIALGLLLTGPGRVWLDDLSFEVVGKEVPVTGPAPSKEAPSGPVNLNFED